MKKTTIISWNKRQLNRLANAVKAFNKNLRRIKRRKDIGNQINLQSINKHELKRQIGTAKELNRIVNQLNKFAEIKGKPKMYTNKQGVTMTEWEHRKINSDIRVINNERKRKQEQIEKATVYDYSGNPIPNAVREQSKYENKPIQTSPENVSNVENLKLLSKRINKILFNINPEIQLDALKRGLQKAIDTNLPNEEGERFKCILESMSYEQLEEMYIENSDIINNGDAFNYAIYQSSVAVNAYLDMLNDILSPYEK